jgi:hypothetical protein
MAGYGPEGEVLTCVSNVCSPRNCGRDVLALSLTRFWPQAARIDVRSHVGILVGPAARAVMTKRGYEGG